MLTCHASAASAAAMVFDMRASTRAVWGAPAQTSRRDVRKENVNETRVFGFHFGIQYFSYRVAWVLWTNKLLPGGRGLSVCLSVCLAVRLLGPFMSL